MRQSRHIVNLRALIATGIIAFAITLQLLHASGDVPSIHFTLSSSPYQGGVQTEGVLGIRLSQAFEAKLQASYQTSSDTRNVLEIADSLDLAQQELTELHIIPLSYSIVPAHSKIQIFLGCGGYVSWQHMLEVGYFNLGTLGLNSYNQQLAASMYGPEFQCSLVGPLAGMQWALDLAIVPVFWYAMNQQMRLSPLIIGESVQKYAGTGSPYFKANLSNDFSRSQSILRFLMVSASYEFQSFKFIQTVPELDTSTSTYHWTSSSTQVDSSTLTLEGNLSIPLSQQGFLQLGAGYRFTWAAYYNGSVGYEGKTVYRIAYSFGRW